MSDKEEVLIEALKKYGQFANGFDKKGELKTKNTAYEEVTVKNISLLGLRDAIVWCGDILEENKTKKYYIASIPVGIGNNLRALAVAQIQGDIVKIAAYANEGLIKQKFASQAINNIKNRLLSKKL